MIRSKAAEQLLSGLCGGIGVTAVISMVKNEPWISNEFSCIIYKV